MMHCAIDACVVSVCKVSSEPFAMSQSLLVVSTALSDRLPLAAY